MATPAMASLVSQASPALASLGTEATPLSATTKATTISTIAVQAGESRVVVALLQAGHRLHLRLLELQPGMAELGEGFSQAARLRADQVGWCLSSYCCHTCRPVCWTAWVASSRLWRNCSDKQTPSSSHSSPRRR